MTALHGGTIGFAAGSFPALSGGPRQRVAMARALATERAVIFGDEPAGALHLRSARDPLALLRSVVGQFGRTMAVVTHYPLAASYADTGVSRGSMS
ncbi:hypothetical protein ACGFJ5_10260 [Micromonospora echinaurantiaca]|uniref:hypothetical protein n=1 Tax=Micromonospora echinaurantiaca TaxID=47857 RepID=UPI00371EA77C